MPRWIRTFFSDEVIFKLDGSDGVLYCRRDVGEENLLRNVRTSVKGSKGKVVALGFITWYGVGPLLLVSNNMDGPEYRRILERGLLVYIDRKGLDPSDIIWAHDNDSKHTAKLTKAWFEEENIECMDWPAQSPDMNIIEHVWAHMKHRLRRRNPPIRNARELWPAVQEEWEAIDIEFIRNLYRSIPRRIEALYRARGWWTKY